MRYRTGSLLLAMILLLLPLQTLSQTAGADLFSQTRSGLFVVKTTDPKSNQRVSLGSGFLVDGSGLIATNYHVISKQLLHPEHFSLAFESVDDDSGALTVVAVDVIHDLALVRGNLGAVEPSRYQFQLAESLPTKGAELTSMGNPYDLGFSVIPGTFNGKTRHSYQGRLHFTGPINAGMSGGPTLNGDGEVIGINVATAGDSVSFLVQVKYLQALIESNQRGGDLSYEDLRKRLGEDLIQYQATLIGALIDHDWDLVTFGPIQIPEKAADFVNCIGRVTDPDLVEGYRKHETDCSVNDEIFLAPGFSTGTIELDYSWLSNTNLSTWQFYNMFDGIDFAPYNSVGKEDATEFECHEDIIYVDALPGETFKGVFCVRAYVDYADLHDVLFLARSLDGPDESFTLHFTLAGVTLETAYAFNKKFLESVTWN